MLDAGVVRWAGRGEKPSLGVEGRGCVQALRGLREHPSLPLRGGEGGTRPVATLKADPSLLLVAFKAGDLEAELCLAVLT